MKNVIATIILLAITLQGHAQGWEEWFQQRKTQKKYLIQQIAALKAYISYAQKGYDIAKDGLKEIGGLTGSEFGLHRVYFNSLKNVNPEIKHYPKAQHTIELKERIVKDCNSNYSSLRQSAEFTDAELDYIRRVYDRLLKECEIALDQLIEVTSSGKLEMKDDERMARIDSIYLQMQDNYTFLQSFSNEAKTLAISRGRDKQDVKSSRALQGLKQE